MVLRSPRSHSPNDDTYTLDKFAKQIPTQWRDQRNFNRRLRGGAKEISGRQVYHLQRPRTTSGTTQ